MNALGVPVADETTDGLPPRLRRMGMAALILAVVMTVMDSTIVNVALPVMARSLHADPARSVWVVNAYQITLTVLLLPFASLGEIWGYRRVSQGGMAVFVLASLWCALCVHLPMLLAARVVQGVGAASVLSVNSALARYLFPTARLGRALGMLSLSIGAATSLAPSIASAVLSVAGWPWLFAINLPIGALALLLARGSLPHTPRSGQRFDGVSAVLSTAALTCLALGVDALGRRHGGWAQAAGLLGGAAILAVVLWRRQRARTAPLLPVDLLLIPPFRLAILTSLCSFAAQTLAFVALPFMLEDRLGFSPATTGLLFTPWPIATGIVAPLAGGMSDRIPAGLLSGAGLLVMGVALGALGTLPAQPAPVTIAVLMAVAGVGFGLFQTPNTRSMLAASPRSRSGGASGMLATARTLGQSLGAGAAAVCLSLLGVQAGPWALWVAAGISATGAAVSVSRLRMKH